MEIYFDNIKDNEDTRYKRFLSYSNLLCGNTICDSRFYYHDEDVYKFCKNNVKNTIYDSYLLIIYMLFLFVPDSSLHKNVCEKIIPKAKEFGILDPEQADSFLAILNGDVVENNNSENSLYRSTLVEEYNQYLTDIPHKDIKQEISDDIERLYRTVKSIKIPYEDTLLNYNYGDKVVSVLQFIHHSSPIIRIPYDGKIIATRRPYINANQISVCCDMAINFNAVISAPNKELYLSEFGRYIVALILEGIVNNKINTDKTYAEVYKNIVKSRLSLILMKTPIFSAVSSILNEKTYQTIFDISNKYGPTNELFYSNTGKRAAIIFLNRKGEKNKAPKIYNQDKRYLYGRSTYLIQYVLEYLEKLGFVEKKEIIESRIVNGERMRATFDGYRLIRSFCSRNVCQLINYNKGAYSSNENIRYITYRRYLILKGIGFGYTDLDSLKDYLERHGIFEIKEIIAYELINLKKLGYNSLNIIFGINNDYEFSGIKKPKLVEKEDALKIKFSKLPAKYLSIYELVMDSDNYISDKYYINYLIKLSMYAMFASIKNSMVIINYRKENDENVICDLILLYDKEKDCKKYNKALFICLDGIGFHKKEVLNEKKMIEAMDDFDQNWAKYIQNKNCFSKHCMYLVRDKNDEIIKDVVEKINKKYIAEMYSLEELFEFIDIKVRS